MKILVGVDLKVQGHEWLLNRAARFARSFGAKIDLVFIALETTSEHQALLNGLLTLFPEEARGVARVETGEPPEVFIRLTPEYEALVIGPREPAALQRWLLGPMAVRIIRRSMCPILVPRGERPWNATPALLVGIDVRTDTVSPIMAFAKMWTERLNGRVSAVYAIPESLPAIANKAVRESAERDFLASKKQEHDLVHKALESIPATWRGEAILGIGEPEDILVQKSAEFDVVLVGNRGRSGLSRLIMGNVANHVVRTAHCDVLVLPTTRLRS